MTAQLKAEVIKAVNELAKEELRLQSIAKKLQGYDIEGAKKVTSFFSLILLTYPALQDNPRAITIVNGLSTNSLSEPPSSPRSKKRLR